MADEWPMPKFHFQAKWDGLEMSCREVSGLDTEAQLVEYRRGDTPEFAAIKMPGLGKFGNVTLKKIVVRADQSLWDLVNQTKTKSVKPMPATISLIDESGKPTMVWTLANAWPTRMTGVDLKPDGDEVVIETIEMVHEGITITDG